MKTLLLAILTLNLLLAEAAKAESNLTFDSAMPAALRTQIEGDLGFLKSITGSGATPLHQQFFGQGAIAGAGYMEFFSARITGFRVDMHPADKLAVAYNRHGVSKLFITPNFIKNDIPQVMRITVFLHEARHSEKNHGYWSHAHCPSPYLDSNGEVVRSILTGIDISGAPACDTTAFGAYGIQAIALKNIQVFCTNCSAKVKMDAGIYGDNHIDSRIIDPAAKKTLLSDVSE